MLHARITSSNAALYIATDPTPYDLENLYGLAGGATNARARVDLQLGSRSSRDPEISAEVSTLVDRLSGHGVRVKLSALHPQR